MAEEIKTILSIDVGNTPKNIKELKQQIKDLQDALVRTDDTTDEYKTTLNTLVASQQKLQSILKATKSEVSAAEGSYNALNATMKSLQQQWKATGDEAERNKLGKAILDINNQLKDLDSSIGNNQRKVGSYTEGVVDAFAQLKSEIKQYKSELLTLEEGTDAYNEKLAQLGEAQFAMKDMTEQAKYAVSDIGETLGAVNKVAQGVVGGFNAIQGIMALTGTESEALQKTMVKLQAGMSIVQGLQGMEGMIDSLKGLNIVFGKGVKSIGTFVKGLSGVKAAIAGTGIGIFVVLLGTLVANWDKVSAAVTKFVNKESDAERAVKNLTNAQRYLNNELERSERLHKQQNDLLRIEGKSEVDIAKGDVKFAENNYDRQAKLTSAAKRQLEHLKFNKENVFMSGISDEDIAKAQENYDKALELQNKYFQEYLDAKHNLEKEETRAKVDAENERKRVAQAAADEQKRIAEQNAEKKKEIIKNEKNEVLKIQKETSLALMSEEDRDLQILKDDYDAKKTLLIKYGKDTKDLTTAYEKERKAIEEEYAKERTDKAREEFEKLKSEFERQLALKRQYADVAFALSESEAYNKSLQSSPTSTKNTWGMFGDNMKDTLLGNPLEDSKLQSEIEYNNSLLAIQQERFNKQKEMWEEEMKHITTSAERKLQIEQEINAATIELDNIATETQIKNAELVKKAQQDKVNRIEQATSASLSVVSDVFSTVSELSDEGSKQAKGFAIAAAVMDTLSSAVAAYKSMVGIPYVGPVLAPIAAATALASGYAQVRKIQSTDEKTGSGGGDGGGYSPSATPNIAALSDSLPISYTRNIMGDAETEEMNQSQKVYILESDIQESNRRVEIREENSEF